MTMAAHSLRKAVILSAGFGTRLGTLTKDRPKVMAPINGKPMLEHHIEWLRDAGLREFYLNLHYLPDVIADYFGDGSRYGVSIRYSREERLQGTAGSLRAFASDLTEAFLVQYGDVFSRLNVKNFMNFHQKRNSSASLVVHPSSHPEDSDVVTLDPNSRITSFHHKPGTTRFGNLGNAGVYLLDPSVLEYISTNQHCEEDFCRDVFPKILLRGGAVFGYMTNDLLLDVGTPERLMWIDRHFSEL